MTMPVFGHAFTPDRGNGNWCECGEHRFASIHNPDRCPFEPELHESVESYISTARAWISRSALEDQLLGVAEEAEWRAVGLIAGADGEPLEDADETEGRDPHPCEQARWTSNSWAIRRILDEARADWQIWRGMYAYNAADVATVEAVEGIERSLADYPSLDDVWLSQIEYDSATWELIHNYKVPREAVEAVIDELGERGVSLCDRCESWPLDEITPAVGWTPCDECGEWLHTEQSLPLCLPCAEAMEEDGCECVAIMLDTMRNLGAIPTRSDVFTVQVNCDHCVQQILPFAPARS